jgi:hypothetical protein
MQLEEEGQEEQPRHLYGSAALPVPDEYAAIPRDLRQEQNYENKDNISNGRPFEQSDKGHQ